MARVSRRKVYTNRNSVRRNNNRNNRNNGKKSKRRTNTKRSKNKRSRSKGSRRRHQSQKGGEENCVRFSEYKKEGSVPIMMCTLILKEKKKYLF